MLNLRLCKFAPSLSRACCTFVQPANNNVWKRLLFNLTDGRLFKIVPIGYLGKKTMGTWRWRCTNLHKRRFNIDEFYWISNYAYSKRHDIRIHKDQSKQILQSVTFNVCQFTHFSLPCSCFRHLCHSSLRQSAIGLPIWLDVVRTCIFHYKRINNL